MSSSPEFPCRPDPAGPLPLLRAATRTRHIRVDRLMDLQRMKDRGHYARVLQVFDAFLAGWEPAVAATLPVRWHGWLRARSRRQFLLQDLRVLGIDRLHASSAPRIDNAAAAWGSLYVLEGSALGGQVITRSLAEAGLHPQRGAAYFHGWGPEAGAMWREFRTILGTEIADACAGAQACDAACRTFDLLTRQLEAALHERAPAA